MMHDKNWLSYEKQKEQYIHVYIIIHAEIKFNFSQMG